MTTDKEFELLGKRGQKARLKDIYSKIRLIDAVFSRTKIASIEPLLFSQLANFSSR